MCLHAKYGPVVRLSPNEVSFISGETAWQDIYGFRTGKMKGQANMQKNPAWYAQPPTGSSHIIVANDEDHSRYRRTFSHAFSEKALANQEVLLQKYVDLLVGRLKELVSTDKVQDMVGISEREHAVITLPGWIFAFRDPSESTAAAESGGV